MVCVFTKITIAAWELHTALSHYIYIYLYVVCWIIYRVWIEVYHYEFNTARHVCCKYGILLMPKMGVVKGFIYFII